MTKYIKHEIKKMFMQWETWAVIAVCFALIPAATAEHMMWFDDKFIEPARPRSERYMLVASAIGYAYVLIIAPLLASIPCACSYYKEKNSHLNIILTSRVGRNRYYIGKMIVVAVTGFVVAVLPLAVQYIICMLTMPEGDIYYLWSSVYDSVESYNDIILNTTVFPYLYMNYQDLSVFVHIALCGLWIMGLSMLTYTFSLYFSKNMVTTMLFSTVINVVYVLTLSALKLNFLTPGTYFYPGSGIYDINFPAFALTWAVLILINIIMLAVKIRFKKDIL